ncbi:putative harbinger transposase-derived protein [Helianthus annuus]|nr:putative harbinger transposase-derived protein [Helianthus annuus]
MSYNESLLESSSSDSSDSNDFDAWHERVIQSNRQLEDIMIELLISEPNMIIQDHPRARRRYCNREREHGEARLMQDYFVDNPTYDQATFRRRFRMQKPLFLRIVAAVTANDIYFQQRRDATGRQGLSPLQKCTGAMRVLAYGTSADAHDEYLRMSETVTRASLIKFVEGVISCFGQEYLRRPNNGDLARLLHVGADRGFPGMVGSIDCMHWEWKNCPTAWAGQYAGRSGKPTIILEAVASYDLWIWHAFFGTPGQAPHVSYVVNGREYNRTYYLTDGIYPSWAAFVNSITSPQLRKHKLFAQHQEAVRKDVERAFGVLQARFAFLRHPCLVWDKDMMGKIMIACIIIHNMIVEDERDTYLHYYDPSEFLNDTPTNRHQTSSTEGDEQSFQYSTERIADLSSYMTNRTQLHNREAHNALKNDLIEHIWQKFSVDE